MNVRIAIAFASTGGAKMERAVRSLRRMEPDLPIYVFIDVSSNTWKQSGKKAHTPFLDDDPEVIVYQIENRAHINGTLNAAMRELADRYSHVCLFHDDLVFSPLSINRNYLSKWFDRIAASTDLQSAAALSFGELEVFYKNPGTVRHQPGHWDAPPAVWDAMDLESTAFWSHLILPDGSPVDEADFGEFFVEFCPLHHSEFGRRLRMGPTGQIVSVAAWQAVGGFDETFGLHYDTDFPFACIVHGAGPVLYLPGAPHLHLHNQSMGYADPATGIWSHFDESFQAKYGKTLNAFCVEQEAVWRENPLSIVG